MLAKEIELLPGMPITSPGGRRLEVGDVFVPRHDVTKSRSLPPSFRHVARKVVVFRDGSIAPLSEVKQRFHCVLVQADEHPVYQQKDYQQTVHQQTVHQQTVYRENVHQPKARQQKTKQPGKSCEL
jgi:hypothetical protein